MATVITPDGQIQRNVGVESWNEGQEGSMAVEMNGEKEGLDCGELEELRREKITLRDVLNVISDIASEAKQAVNSTYGTKSFAQRKLHCNALLVGLATIVNDSDRFLSAPFESEFQRKEN